MIDSDVQLGKNVRIYNKDQVNIFGCIIGDNSFVGPFVEITRNTAIGKNCIIESHSFLCDSVTLEDDVFIGHGAMFTNDLYPIVGTKVEYLKTLVKRGVSIGTNATIVGGVTIGEYSVIGAGAVVTKDVDDYSIYAGNPAKKLRGFKNKEELIAYMRSKQKLAK
ncbi:MAG: N-acetyltransferase [Bacteroidia bacterium]|nr:N-acetyltransferase [Bacteroidia bacterium]